MGLFEYGSLLKYVDTAEHMKHIFMKELCTSCAISTCFKRNLIHEKRHTATHCNKRPMTETSDRDLDWVSFVDIPEVQ